MPETCKCIKDQITHPLTHKLQGHIQTHILSHKYRSHIHIYTQTVHTQTLSFSLSHACIIKTQSHPLFTRSSLLSLLLSFFCNQCSTMNPKTIQTTKNSVYSFYRQVWPDICYWMYVYVEVDLLITTEVLHTHTHTHTTAEGLYTHVHTQMGSLTK